MSIDTPPPGSRVSARPATLVIQAEPTQRGTQPSRQTMLALRRYADLTGLPLVAVNGVTGEVCLRTDQEVPVVLPPSVLRQLGVVASPRVIEYGDDLLFCLMPLPGDSGERLTAVGLAVSGPDTRPQEIVLAAAQQGLAEAALARWLDQLPVASPEVLRRLCHAAATVADQEVREEVLNREIDELSYQIGHTYEEISLLHTLTQHLQLSRSPLELAQLCLDRMHELMGAEGNAIWLEERKADRSFLLRGDVPLDELDLAQLIAGFDRHNWPRPLVLNGFNYTEFGRQFDGLRNVVIVPIAEGRNRFGWLVSCNLTDGEEFGTVQASLANSIATLLGTHAQNIDLYRQHDDLLLSFVRSLVSTLDAKDPYTRGHSERVALIARRLGEELKLPAADLHSLYVAGLLHDIGKIGVDDRILQKPGRLTDEEFRNIQQHPLIGYNILQGLTNLQHVLPGVRNHHETWAGTGYPDQLKGEDSPQMARILAVADSYDAMGSDRPYRQGMPVPQIEELFRRGAGGQWDAAVIEAYFACADDIAAICNSYSLTDGNLLTMSLAAS